MDAIWFAKTEDGRVYGPVGVEKLAAWAREGRLEPTSLISRDRVTWSPAPQKAALGMNWLIETAVGSWHGPFHRDVIEELFKANQVPADARIYRLSSRQAVASGGAPAASGAAPAAPAAALAAASQEKLVELQKKLDAEIAERKRLAKENEKLANENAKLSKAKKGKGFGDFLFGKREVDFAKLELAAQRELAAAKQRGEANAAGSAPLDVIDIA